MEQEIRCRITKLDEAEEDLVVDRRVIAEEEERAVKDRRYSEVAGRRNGEWHGSQPDRLWGFH